jgi:hypothetical protein
MKYLLFFFLIIPFPVLCAPPLSQKIYRSSEGVINADMPRTAIFINIDTITTKYIDNTVLMPEIEYNDSFYCSAANNLLLYECSKLFTVKSVLYPSDSILFPRWTSFADSQSSIDSVQKYVRTFAKKFDVGYIVIPYRCTLQHSAVRRGGWRGGKYGGSYEQPVSYSAISKLHVQIWNKNGMLVFEKIGIGSTGRPILYDTVKKRRNEKGDVVSRAKKLFSPPLLRSLSEAAHNALILH